MTALSTLLRQTRPAAGAVVAGAIALSVLLAVMLGTFAVGRESTGFAVTVGLAVIGIASPLLVANRRAGPKTSILCFLLAGAAGAGLFSEAGNTGSKILLLVSVALALGMAVLATLVNAEETASSSNRF